jgi:AraC family transcriptional regulator, exoenzyme S synthesis regulatory protein ExsA
MTAGNEFVVPRFFVGQDQFPYLRVDDDFSAVQYRSSSNQYRNRIIATSHLFVIVLSGEKIVHTADGDLHLAAGSAFFAQKGSYLFSEILSTQTVYQTLVFFIGDSLLERFMETHHRLLQYTADDLSVPIFPIPVTPLLAASAAATLPYFEHDTPHSRQLLRTKLEEILLHLVATDIEGRFMRFLLAQRSIRKRDLRLLMEEYFLKPLTLSELAQLSGRSLSAFKRDFDVVFHDSPRRWITNRRLEHAMLLLLTATDLNISEVCLRAGFENFSSFSQLFKKKYGKSPSDWQRIHRQQSLSRQPQHVSKGVVG